MSNWIPIKTRPTTEEEKEYYSEYTSYGCDFIFDCPLPDDGQEVLVSTKYGNVTMDTFWRDDGSDGCYFKNYDADDITAWMPLPDLYVDDGVEEQKCQTS